MHNFADPIDAAIGIPGLTVPNAPAQTFDLHDVRWPGVCTALSGFSA